MKSAKVMRPCSGDAGGDDVVEWCVFGHVVGFLFN